MEPPTHPRPPPLFKGAPPPPPPTRPPLSLGEYWRAGHLFLTFPHPCPFLPPPHQTIWCTFSSCLRIWPILCTQFMAMAMVVVGSGGSGILCY